MRCAKGLVPYFAVGVACIVAGECRLPAQAQTHGYTYFGSGADYSGPPTATDPDSRPNAAAWERYRAAHPSDPVQQAWNTARLAATTNLSIEQQQRAVEAAAKFEGMKGYQKDLVDGKSPAEALARWAPLLYYNDPARMSAALEQARETPPKSFTPGALEREEGKMVSGTGFFVADDGYIVTCEHVVRRATTFHVESAGRSFPATLIRKDKSIDIALLKVNGVFRALPVAAEPGLKLGDAVFTIGFPNTAVQGIEPKLTRGEISSMAGIRDNPRYFQISVPVQPGNSGGALVDECGNAVGVIASRLDDARTWETSGSLPQNVNYAVKGGVLCTFLNAMPELRGKLKTPGATTDREAAAAAAESAAVLVIAE